MEEHPVVKKRSVAELAGKFSCQVPVMTEAEVNKPVRRRPPRTLQLPATDDAGQGQDEKGTATAPPRKNRNSALIEKLQANLVLSPTAPAPILKSPGVKLPVLPFSSASPGSPSSPPVTLTPKQEETPISFENPADGTVLKNINKGRARHSIKRRPPSRRHRKSSAEEGVDEADKATSGTHENITTNGHEGDVFEVQKTEEKSSDSADPASLSSIEQTEQETKSADLEKASPKETETGETVSLEKTEEEEKEEKKEEHEEKEEKTEDEPQLVSSTSESTAQEETREESDTPQAEPDKTTDEKEKEQKEDNKGNH